MGSNLCKPRLIKASKIIKVIEKEALEHVTVQCLSTEFLHISFQELFHYFGSTYSRFETEQKLRASLIGHRRESIVGVNIFLAVVRIVLCVSRQKERKRKRKREREDTAGTYSCTSEVN